MMNNLKMDKFQVFSFSVMDIFSLYLVWLELPFKQHPLVLEFHFSFKFPDCSISSSAVLFAFGLWLVDCIMLEVMNLKVESFNCLHMSFCSYAPLICQVGQLSQKNNFTAYNQSPLCGDDSYNML